MVIEDASHASHHQQITLAALFPLMKSGGLFCIEDLHWQPEDLEPKDAPRTRDVIRNGYQSPYIQDSEAAFLRANVKSVRFFDSNDKFNEDSHDALVIIERLGRVLINAQIRLWGRSENRMLDHGEDCAWFTAQD